MEKQELLNSIKELSAQQLITEDEVINAYLDGQGNKNSLTRRLNVSRVLYYIGGAIIFLGIAIFVYQNWSEISFATRIIATLGSAVAAYAAGWAFTRREESDGVGQAFFLISALVAPLGIAVLFDHFGVNTTSPEIQAAIAALLFVIYFASYWLMRKGVFEIFLFTFGTWLFFALASLVAGDRLPLTSQEMFLEYRYLITGMAYILFGYWYSTRPHRGLSGPLYGFGSLFFLGAALFLGGWSVMQTNSFWTIIFPILDLALIVLSVNLHSKALLTFGAIFLMVYIMKLTGIYFEKAIGWPLALVLAGLLLMAIGYYSVYIGKRYISKRVPTPHIL